MKKEELSKKIRNKIETMSTAKFIAMMLVLTLTLLAFIIIMWIYLFPFFLLILLLSDGILIYLAFKYKYVIVSLFPWPRQIYKKDAPVYYYLGVGAYFIAAFLLILLLLHYF